MDITKAVRFLFLYSVALSLFLSDRPLKPNGFSDFSLTHQYYYMCIMGSELMPNGWDPVNR